MGRGTTRGRSRNEEGGHGIKQNTINESRIQGGMLINWKKEGSYRKTN